MTYLLEFFDDPAKFLAVVGSWLEADPVKNTVVATVSARLARDGLPEESPAPIWWVVVRDEAGTLVGAAMRAIDEAPYPAYVLAMPDDAARELARQLRARGEQVLAVNGAMQSAKVFAAETASLVGGSSRLAERMRLYELGGLTMPPKPPGRLRIAVADELDVVLGYFNAFAGDAAEQAGHIHAHPAPIETRESTLRRIERGEVWVWQVGGAAVHATAFNPPRFGVARVGPVYTPREHRGQGYAAAAVAEVSRTLLDGGNRVCLFADLANPVSCALYERLGYQPVVDMANLVIEGGAGQDG